MPLHQWQLHLLKLQTHTKTLQSSVPGHCILLAMSQDHEASETVLLGSGGTVKNLLGLKMGPSGGAVLTVRFVSLV
jgi:hypothetical protein